MLKIIPTSHQISSSYFLPGLYENDLLIYGKRGRAESAGWTNEWMNQPTNQPTNQRKNKRTNDRTTDRRKEGRKEGRKIA